MKNNNEKISGRKTKRPQIPTHLEPKSAETTIYKWHEKEDETAPGYFELYKEPEKHDLDAFRKTRRPEIY